MTRLLSPREAADFLKTVPDVLAQWRWRRKGPAYSKIGSRKVVYDLDDLEAFVAAGRVETSADTRRQPTPPTQPAAE